MTIHRAGRLTLILGGVRSGKSRFAEELARSLGNESVLYVATAEALDDEMQQRIAKHQQSRPSGWLTLELRKNIGKYLLDLEPLPSVVLVDCLTLLVTNRLCEADLERLDNTSIQQVELAIRDECLQLMKVAEKRSTQLIVVSGEVGMGIVPEFKAGRIFRDLLGWANQTLAREASAVYCLIAGMALPLHRCCTSVAEAVKELSAPHFAAASTVSHNDGEVAREGVLGPQNSESQRDGVTRGELSVGKEEKK